MPIRCIFHLEKHPQPCQVLQALGAPALSSRTRSALEQRYCHCGSFVCCPIFQRVEERLEQFEEHARVCAVA